MKNIKIKLCRFNQWMSYYILSIPESVTAYMIDLFIDGYIINCKRNNQKYTTDEIMNSIIGTFGGSYTELEFDIGKII